MRGAASSRCPLYPTPIEGRRERAREGGGDDRQTRTPSLATHPSDWSYPMMYLKSNVTRVTNCPGAVAVMGWSGDHMLRGSEEARRDAHPMGEQNTAPESMVGGGRRWLEHV